MKAFKKATIEISNICNAKCTWCTTGLSNREGCKVKPEYMTVDSFEKGLIYMQEKGIVDSKTEIELYNWGEPFLNPDINDICGIITKYGYSYHLSTNASVFRKIDSANLKNLSGFRVSLSGFSKETYSITHALNFNQVMKNINKFSDMLKQAGKLNLMDISFLVYKFNCHEIYSAKDYFNQLGINLTPRLAFHADFEKCYQFLNNEMPDNVKKLSEKHIFEDLWKKRVSEAPKDFSCPQQDFIVMSHKWKIVPCCWLTENESIGNLYNMNLTQIREAKINTPQCEECISTKQHYIVHSPTVFRFSIDPPNKVRTPKLYLDFGEGLSEANVCRVGKISEDNGSFYAEYTFDKAPINVRFDPVEREYCILDEFRAETERGVIEPSRCNGKVSDGIFYFDNYDPQIYLKDVNSKKLVISARVHTFNNPVALRAMKKYKETLE